MFASFLILLTAAIEPQIIATFNDSAATREGIKAEQIRLPTMISPEVFADELVEAEGLISWLPEGQISSNPGEQLETRARFAANGREVVVYFSRNKRTVCRIRRRHGGGSDAHWRAIRWCAASLDIALPAKRPPAIVQLDN